LNPQTASGWDTARLERRRLRRYKFHAIESSWEKSGDCKIARIDLR